MNKVLTKISSCIIIFSFAIAVLCINTGFHSSLARGEKPAVCDSEDKSVNSTESKICGTPTTKENRTNATTIRK